eukprot:4187267-Ditylum_brightwellii.AAC.1
MHHSVLAIFLRLCAPNCGVISKKDSLLMYNTLKGIIVNHETVQAKICQHQAEQSLFKAKYDDDDPNENTNDDGNGNDMDNDVNDDNENDS